MDTDERGRRVTLGQCIDCPKPARVDRLRCVVCSEKALRDQRKRYRARHPHAKARRFRCGLCKQEGHDRRRCGTAASVSLMTTERKSWDAYFIDIAEMVATRATCDRKHVGAVIVVDHRIVATGYNGSIPGAAHCDEVGHDMQNDHCVRTIHAEANAIAQAARFGIDVDGATLYTNTFPCWPCFKLVASAGVTRIVYDAEYRKDDRVVTGACDGVISLVRFQR